MQKPLSWFKDQAINAWIFDLDNTIYPANSGLFKRVERRMTMFVQNHLGIDYEPAYALQKDLFHRYGMTVTGLVLEHGVDANEYMDFVHQIDLSDIEPDLELDALLGSLEGKKIIFTNGTAKHANAILGAYGIGHHFSGCYDIVRGNHRPKPDPAVYAECVAEYAIVPETAAMFEDMAVNLAPAADMGMTTVWLNDAPKTDLDTQQASIQIDFIDNDLKTFLTKITPDR